MRLLDDVADFGGVELLHFAFLKFLWLPRAWCSECRVFKFSVTSRCMLVRQLREPATERPVDHRVTGTNDARRRSMDGSTLAGHARPHFSKLALTARAFNVCSMLCIGQRKAALITSTSKRRLLFLRAEHLELLG